MQILGMACRINSRSAAKSPIARLKLARDSNAEGEYPNTREKLVGTLEGAGVIFISEMAAEPE